MLVIWYKEFLSMATEKNRKQKLQLQFLCENIEKEKNTVEGFLEENVPQPLWEQVKEIMAHLMERAVEIQKKRTKTFQERQELKNTEIVCSKVQKVNKMQYWQLLQVLYKFPNDFQIGVDDFLSQYIRKSSYFKDLDKIIHIDMYISNNWSLKRFLTDCIAFSRLRRLQLKYIKEAKDDSNPMEKAMQIEKEFSVIPDNLILERRIGGDRNIGVFKGMDISKNVPVVIKYLRQDFQEENGMTLQEAKKRFEREAQAFEKLERHRQAKEQAVHMLLEQAQKQIEEGRQTSNAEKMKSGLALMKQGDKLRCDRYFIKAYCLATGLMERYSLTKIGFIRTEPTQVGFMVMEYIEGVNLRVLMDEYRTKKTPFPMKIFLPIMDGILQALEYCHTEGIIHRDIRPENILITKDFRVRLANLGLAKVEDMTQLTAQGAFVGTPGFASPEGILQSNKCSSDELSDMVTATDHRFDLYSLGCVAYEMLAGHPVFQSTKKNLEERNLEILDKHLHDQPVPITEFRKDIPDALNLLILKLLAKNPEHRFESAQETLIALHTVMTLGQKASEYTQKFLERLRPEEQETVFPETPESSWKKFIVLAIMLLLIGVGLLTFTAKPTTNNTVWEISRQSFQWLRLQYAKVFSPELLERIETEQQLEKIVKYHDELKEQWDKNNKIYKTLLLDFSPEDGYPSLIDTVQYMHAHSEKSINELKDNSDEAEKLISTDLKKAREILKPLMDLLEENSLKLLLQRIAGRLETTYNIALQLKQQRIAEKEIITANRKLRNSLFSAEETFAFIEEKLSIFQEMYPANQSYMSTSVEFGKKFKSAKSSIEETAKIIKSLNSLISKNDVNSAKKLLEQSKNFNQIIGVLQDLEAELTTLTTLNQTQKVQREKQETLNRCLTYLDSSMQQLQENFSTAKILQQEHMKCGKNIAEPTELWQRTESELQKIRQERQKLNDLLNQNKETEALSLAHNILNVPEVDTLQELQNFIQKTKESIQQIKDDLRIQQAVAQKQNLQKQKRIADSLSKLRTQENLIAKALTEWNDSSNKFSQEFPEHVQKIENPKLQNDAKKYQEWTTKIIQDVENSLNQKKIQDAYNLLSKQMRNLSKVVQCVDNLNKAIKNIQDITTSIIQERENAILLAKTKRIAQRLETNISIMENQLQPLERDVAKIHEEFQPRDKYPEIPQKSLECIDDARYWIQYYQTKLAKANEYMEAQKVKDAFEVLQEFEGVRLSGYTKMLENIESIQSDIIKTRNNCEIIKTHLARSGEYDKLKQELEQRRDELTATIAQLKNKITELSQFSVEDGYQVADKNIPKYMQDGQTEINDITRALAQGNEYLKQEQFARATNLLKPFSLELHPGTSFLSLLKTYLKQCESRLQENYALQQNSSARASILQQQASQKQQDEARRQLRTSPGAWFNQIQDFLVKYDSLEQKLIKAFQGKGCFMVHYRIKALLKEIIDYPDLMAELKSLENDAKNRGINEEELKRDHRNKELLNFLHTHSIEPDLSQETQEIKQSVNNIENELKSCWVEEDTIRVLLRAMQSLERKFSDIHQSIKSRLLVLTTN